MPRLIPGQVHIQGDQNVECSQETTGELKTSMKGTHDEELVSVAVDRNGNLMDYASRELFEQILFELQKVNVQLSMITDHELKESDLDGNK